MRALLVPCLMAGVCLAAPRADGQESRFEWQTATAASQGMSAEKLEAMKERLIAKGTKGLLIARNDRIVLEWYANPDAKSHYTASMAKALVGGVAVAVAMTDGKIALDNPAAKYVPQWRDDPQKSKIS